ncbi:hypothetical protein HanXRQr2_Chr02g0060231 [Helianthus annuus]|uniref:Uncharacterized protein n=1 Tax=Helianthus annuus TaxID=4232 RepID=A0A9K3NZS8_HELAN|nr:hypothetical protein HanXRQr2_Chr02g0060231 [Helianthus annuus]KAJ0614914.1 hypothetical protein HanIR_Chr02g0067911 [Helianthus annuus]KAJ0951382.1 hypothetical protein HanPSC8_Chr02g0059321 [Helianthus annuus]
MMSVTPLSKAEARSVIMKGFHCIRLVNILHAHKNNFKHHYITENIVKCLHYETTYCLKVTTLFKTNINDIHEHE